MSYKTDLNKIFRKHALSPPLLRGENILQEITQEITQEMKLKYPGNYTVELCFQFRRGTWEPLLKFDNSQEETMFLLRYS